MDISGTATSVCQEGKDQVARRGVENSEHGTWRKVLGSKAEEAARDQILYILLHFSECHLFRAEWEWGLFGVKQVNNRKSTTF